jgi:pimeloyl-ACP methyl ester carboxylesterase
MDHSGIDRFHLVGAKINGTNRPRLRRAPAGRLKTLTIVGSPPPFRSGSPKSPGQSRCSTKASNWARQNMGNRLGSAFPPEGFEFWCKFMGRTAVSTQLGFMGTIACADIRADIPKIACPTLVITTQDSGLGSVADMRAWQEQIKGSELIVLPGNSYTSPPPAPIQRRDAALHRAPRRSGQA